MTSALTKPAIIRTFDDLNHLVECQKPIQDIHLGQLLISEGIICDQELDTAIEQQKIHPEKRIGHILVSMGATTEHHINSALARKFGIPTVAIDNFMIGSDLLGLIPVDLATQYRVLPLARVSGRLIVAMENPLDWEALDALRFHTNHIIEAVMTSAEQLQHCFNKYYGKFNEKEVIDEIKLHPVGELANLDAYAQQLGGDATKQPIVRLLNSILVQAIERGATDIHLRPSKERVSIYFRTDGHLQLNRAIEKSLLGPLVNRVKIIGLMDPSERRLPQVGHAQLNKGQETLHLRLSVTPTINGESIVIRLVRDKPYVERLEDLGLWDRDLAAMQKILAHSSGLFIVSGLAATGKSTTLYTLLREIKVHHAHIVTIEDPVEYALEEVEQIQVLPASGYHHLQALKHCLHHDPDVIMLDEINEPEVAALANQAAINGRLVLSSLSTQDSASAIILLQQMGIEPYQLAASLRGVMAQRLIRLNCEHCKAPESVDPKILHSVRARENETFYRGKGCSKCQYTGYKNRTMVCELLAITPTISQLISMQATAKEIKAAALAQGLRPITENALNLARRGMTSFEEVHALRIE